MLAQCVRGYNVGLTSSAWSTWRFQFSPVCASISRSYFSLYERCANCFLWCFCVIFCPNYRSPFCFPKYPSGSSALYGCVQIHYDIYWRFFRLSNLLLLLRVQLSIFLDTTAQNSFLRFIPLCRNSLSCCGGHAMRIRVTYSIHSEFRR
jgi:hypothetical protein